MRKMSTFFKDKIQRIEKGTRVRMERLVYDPLLSPEYLELVTVRIAAYLSR